MVHGTAREFLLNDDLDSEFATTKANACLVLWRGIWLSVSRRVLSRYTRLHTTRNLHCTWFALTMPGAHPQLGRLDGSRALPLLLDNSALFSLDQ